MHNSRDIASAAPGRLGASRAYLGLGANLGMRHEQLRHAIELLCADGTSVARCSSLYETAPYGPIKAQPDYLNAVAEVRVDGPPIQLLKRCQRIERQMGRQPGPPMGPRCIDLDLLLFEQQIIETEELVVPHPGLTERAFVLVPLLELEPELVDPRDERPLQRHLQRVCRTQSIRRVSPPLATEMHR